jgi:hypothetical protein
VFLISQQRWVRLSLRGQEEWSTIFPFGKIPILCISTQKITFEVNADPESVMAADWEQLSQKQQEAILEKLSQQGPSSTTAVLSDMMKFGLPIRRSHIDCCGINEWNYLC